MRKSLSEMKIKNWKEYNESISGTELIGNHVGPGYPVQELPLTLSRSSTELLEGSDGNIYTYDDWLTLYQDYLKSGGKVLNQFTKNNLDIILNYLGKI